MYIVTVEKRPGNFVFGTPPVVYAAYDDAKAEAVRLCAKHGGQYYVFRAVSVSRSQSVETVPL